MALVMEPNVAYGNMTILELAQMLGTDLRCVERMVQRGEIPCQKVGGHLRVNRMQIHQWLRGRLGSLTAQNLCEIDQGMAQTRRLDPEQVLVTPHLQQEAISLELGARTKSSALRRLVQLAERTGRVWDPTALLEAVLEREEAGGTALAGGVAIPHPCKPLPYGVAEPIVVVARVSQGLVWGAPDGGLTHLCFLTASQDSTDHLHILARLCRLIHEESVVQGLLAAGSERQMLEVIIDAEAHLLARSL